MNRGEAPSGPAANQQPSSEAGVGAEKHSARRIVLKALAEVWGLFVDDGALASALVVWCVLAAWGFPAVGVGPAARAPLLFVGCLLILTIDVLAAALRRRARAQP